MLCCNICGYKQYDEETLKNHKHDIYICGACQDTLSDEEYNFYCGEKRRIKK